MQNQGMNGGAPGTGDEGPGAVTKVHVFESPGSTEYGFTCDASGANLPEPDGEAWKHWRTVDMGPGAEMQVGVDPDEIEQAIRDSGFLVTTIDDMPTI
jgi:hypothetical protein